MAPSSLAAQLAQIAANSKSTLNVKAQKAAHAKSLIFEPKVAAGQSFQTVYTICREGFDDLCHLDARFAPYSETLFSEQSQEEDRTQMTAAENAELDKRVDAFLRLVGAKLRLMPAIKAVEWLIRRFRIHEYSTASLITAFLPYHAAPAFVTLMSILPTKIPHKYRFLDPYIRSLTSPPRATIVQQAIHHFDLLSTISTWTLESCQAQQHYPGLLSFWGGVMTEAVNGMLDHMRSGRKTIQRDNDQDLLQKLLPILGEALMMKKVPGLQVATYMVISVYAAKGDLDDAVLLEFMHQLVLGWTGETVRPGLVCLSILAQYRSAKQLSWKVAKSLIKVQDLEHLLLDVHKEHRIDKLANGLALALIERLTKRGDARGFPLIKTVLATRMLSEKQASVMFRSLLIAGVKITDDVDEDGQARRQLGLAIVALSQAPDESGEFFRKVVEEAEFDIDDLELRLGASIRPKKAIKQAEGNDKPADDEAAAALAEELDLDAGLSRLSKHKKPPARTCLASDSDPIFDELCQLFITAASDKADLMKLDEVSILERDTAPADCFYFSFYMRIWLGPYPILARARALEMAKNRLQEPDCAKLDFQALQPYCIAALADPAKKVRRAARSRKKNGTPWGSQGLYKKAQGLKWLTPEADRTLLEVVIVPALEEAIMHDDHILAVLKQALESSSKSSTEKETPKKGHISSSARASIFAFLASHVVDSPLLNLKLRLLKALNQVQKVSTLVHTDASSLADKEGLDENKIDSAFVDIVVANDTAGLECLFDIIQSKTAQDRPSLGTVSEEATDLLRNVPLTTDILLTFLAALQDVAQLATDPPASKRRRTSSSDHHRVAEVQNSPELAAALRKITFVLQLVESSHPAEHPELLQSLFMVLSELQTFRTLVGSELGYLQNLVLGSLLAMMPTYRNDKNLKIDTSVGHGDVLVSCIQKSSSPAVQNSALLLVASLAKTAPDVVLHSVMPIFTFMGSSVLRQSDDYSAHVINQTIREVIPPLIETFRKGRKHIVASASELLASFVIAYEHIPSHRRQGLFISLVENLGPQDFLFALVAMFVDKYGTSDNVLTFTADLINHFNVETQLQTLVRFLDLVADMFKPKPNLSATLFGKKEGEEEVNKTALKQLTLLPHILANRSLKREIRKLAERDDSETAKIRELYAQLLEDILTVADTVKSRKTLHARCGDALSNLLNLLSVSEFIKSVETLLDRPNVVLRQKVLRALEARVDSEGQSDVQSRTALLAFLPQLTAVIRDSDDMLYKHTAVTCVDKISEKYGKKDVEAVAAAAATIAGKQCLGQGDRRLRIMALLCLASLVDVLQDGITPVLPTAIPQTLAYLQESLNGVDSDTELHNACYSLLTALAQHLPYMFSGSYLDQLLAISNKSAEALLGDEDHENRTQCLHFLAKQVDAKVLFAALQKNWASAMDAGYAAIQEFINVLGLTIDKNSKASVGKNVSSLAAILFGTFDLRRQEHALERANMTMVAELEEAIFDVALKMVYKLNDAAFRPVFSQLIEWACSGLPKADTLGATLRQQSVFGFLYRFFDNLKSIVTSYASYLLEPAAKILKDTKPKDDEQRELWRRVLKTLTKCFEHDQDDFWQAPSHFSAIGPVLVEQFLHAPHMDLAEELIPAVVELAAAADSQEHQKELNTTLLKHLRSETAAVRLAVVRCEQALVDKVGEEWLAMLPEMLPYISELQDDDDEVVDRETHRWIVKIEGVLGESLDSMLQ
ncbi:U3 small nucleolar RNA-associated protein 10 [Cryphonectria parasitica EP155]|uniref:U3 small nucleolar RNA-associated protein 10 n=1 Tax=Cryphonectria parasitica (strain ATCC 38755 / EP155) TaxID=660469 RepID=A0A9P4YBQ9_CRYP1|nr:U3 small nucleolar RNA-associated protein 10 [Cryphonectria parasitica EP155]KAF3770110.1 U3 small nucleolar RNA-associated protein 10 [Cryphonectria parasitica EP155]